MICRLARVEVAQAVQVYCASERTEVVNPFLQLPPPRLYHATCPHVHLQLMACQRQRLAHLAADIAEGKFALHLPPHNRPEGRCKAAPIGVHEDSTPLQIRPFPLYQ